MKRLFLAEFRKVFRRVPQSYTARYQLSAKLCDFISETLREKKILIRQPHAGDEVKKL